MYSTSNTAGHINSLNLLNSVRVSGLSAHSFSIGRATKIQVPLRFYANCISICNQKGRRIQKKICMCVVPFMLGINQIFKNGKRLAQIDRILLLRILCKEMKTTQMEAINRHKLSINYFNFRWHNFRSKPSIHPSNQSTMFACALSQYQPDSQPFMDPIKTGAILITILIGFYLRHKNLVPSYRTNQLATYSPLFIVPTRTHLRFRNIIEFFAEHSKLPSCCR